MKINRRKHNLILRLLKSDKYIRKLLESEEVKKLAIKFKKHPKSKKYTDNNFKWHSFSGIIKIPLRGNFIIPSDPDERFYCLAHEIGHQEEGFFRAKHPCNHWFDSCLSEELEATMSVVKYSKRLKKKFERHFWSLKLADIRDQCKNCLKVLNEGKCPKDEVKKIERYLNVIDRVSNNKSREIIFPISQSLKSKEKNG